ncbi:unnamed protein product [Closterium sp. Naga37s-1]|nr:unnamed protein product [Closterium sp. Naga37s-1]
MVALSAHMPFAPPNGPDDRSIPGNTVANGPDERSIPGNTVAVSADMPFAGLTHFGSAFLEKLEVAQMRCCGRICPNPMLTTSAWCTHQGCQEYLLPPPLFSPPSPATPPSLGPHVLRQHTGCSRTHVAVPLLLTLPVINTPLLTASLTALTSHPTTPDDHIYLVHSPRVPALPHLLLSHICLEDTPGVLALPHPLLDHICLVDTPGVLAGEKQRTQRSYDFTGVTEWFASNCDLILLLFEPRKLDVSNEFKRVITSLHGNQDKIRLLLNKADQVNTQQVRRVDQLMRVYGALMWSLGKVIITPPVRFTLLLSSHPALSPHALSLLSSPPLSPPPPPPPLQLMRVYGALMWSLGKVINTPEVMRVYIG